MPSRNAIKLFSMSNGELVPMNSASFDGSRFLESEIRQMLCEPLSEELEIMFVAEEVRAFRANDQRADHIGIHRDGQPAIIEYKRGEATIADFNQVFNYYLYAMSLEIQDFVALAEKYYASKGKRREQAKLDICDFVGESDPDKLALNNGMKSKIYLIADGFPKALYYLASKLQRLGIEMQLNHLQLWRKGETFLVTLDKVFPFEPTAMDSNACMERFTRALPNDKETYFRFWSMVMHVFRSANATRFVDNEPASAQMLMRSWHNKEGVSFCLYLNLSEAGVLMYFPKSKYVLNALFERRARIHERFGGNLEWRLRRNRFGIYRKAFIRDERQWDEIAEWMLEVFPRFEAAVDPELRAILSGS